MERKSHSTFSTLFWVLGGGGDERSKIKQMMISWMHIKLQFFTVPAPNSILPSNSSPLTHNCYCFLSSFLSPADLWPHRKPRHSCFFLPSIRSRATFSSKSLILDDAFSSLEKKAHSLAVLCVCLDRNYWAERRTSGQPTWDKKTQQLSRVRFLLLWGKVNWNYVHFFWRWGWRVSM